MLIVELLVLISHFCLLLVTKRMDSIRGQHLIELKKEFKTSVLSSNYNLVGGRRGVAQINK
jgi:hypothetical protein